ncbi:hypothetical protein [Streptomyces sp. NPDC001530]|uniref:hypothetical protein n=1 Tax=Streptomyces sp. NPDC001530 TaxID=3364582 RepID=UPI0036C53464
MSDVVPATKGVLAAAGSVIAEGVRFTILVVQLAAAGMQLRHLAGLANSTFGYVEDCASNVDQLAETAASLNVDADTVGEHHQAATVMRSALAHARSMEAAALEMSTLFQQASDDHQADYGPVAATANAMPVPMADRSFYSNR